MVNAILESRVPVAVYVSPAGAHAASAGTFIGAAANILAMAPVTEIGAAAVVGGQGEELGETLQVKANEDAAALIRGIAEQRGRNAQALEATVFEAKAYSAQEAVEIGIADVVAEDLDQLLHWAEGRTVTTDAGEITLQNLLNTRISESRYSIWDRFLGAIANPNIAFLLISLGSLALIVELWNFGTFIPGNHRHRPIDPRICRYRTAAIPVGRHRPHRSRHSPISSRDIRNPRIRILRHRRSHRTHPWRTIPIPVPINRRTRTPRRAKSKSADGY